VPEFLKTFGEGTMNLFSRWFVERPKIIKIIGIDFVTFGLIYMFYGFFAYIRKGKYLLVSLKTIAFVLFLELFVTGVLKKYPFTVPRTSLFFCPIVFFLTIQGIVFVKNLNIYFYRFIHGLYFVYLFFLIIALSGIALSGELSFRPVLW